MTAFAFYDLLEPGDPIRVLARIEMRRTEDGGRATPFTSKFRPNHNFGSQEDRSFYIGQIEIAENAWIYPGETHDLPITFLNGPGLQEILQVGRTWRIQEGPSHIATAQVLAIQPIPDKTK